MMLLMGENTNFFIQWFEVGESDLIGPDLLHQVMEKLKVIQERLKTTKSRQKSNIYVSRRDMMIGFTLRFHP